MLSLATLAIDDPSFADVFAMHHRPLLRLAVLLTSDEQTAQDVVATAFIKVYPHWRKGRVDNVGGYLRTAVVNESNSSLRRRYRRRERDERRTGDDRGVLTAADRIVEHDAMWDAVESLPDRMKQCVVLRYYEDLSEQETADVLGVSTGTVKSSLSRGIDRIEQHLVATGSAPRSGKGGGS